MGSVASAIGVSVPYVSEIERGTRPLPPKRRAAFAELLGLPVADLTPLDAGTLAAVEARLVAAGRCERAVRVVREMAGGTA